MLGTDLSAAEMRDVMRQIMTGNAGDAQIGGFLIALRMKGESIDEIAGALEGVDVVFLGELHDDSIGHRVQLEVFMKAVERYAGKRPVVLSLEMFERDVLCLVVGA